MSKLFGGSKSKSVQQAQNTSTQGSSSTNFSENRAYPWLQQTYAPYAQQGMDQGLQAQSYLRRLLGLGGPAEADAAWQNYKNTMGFKEAQDAGERAIIGRASTRGLFGSGATAKALTRFGQANHQQYWDKYLDRLGAQAQQSLQLPLSIGQLLAGAGNRSIGLSDSFGQSQGTSSGYSNSSQKPGIAGLLGTIGSGIAGSERRLKDNIIRIGRLKSGLGIYRFNYKGNDAPWIGVMVDEVETICPAALGPVIDGVKTVDYDKIPGWRGVRS